MATYKTKRTIVSPSYLEDLREVFKPLQYYDPKVYKNNSRYSKLRRLYDNKKGVYFHETYIQKFVDESDSDQFFTVTESEKNRLDIIAYSFYGTAKYWWVIATANYIIDPFDVPVGTYLRIPPIVSLYNKGGILSGN